MIEKSRSDQQRHLRLFELLRQKNQAESIITRVGNFDIRRISANEMLQFQKAATQSLQAQN